MTIKEQLDSVIQDYGYIKKFPDGALAGRSSDMVEYMVIQPKPGKKEELRAAAARMNILLNEDMLKIPGGTAKEEVLTFRPMYQPELYNMVREIVKSRGRK